MSRGYAAAGVLVAVMSAAVILRCTDPAIPPGSIPRPVCDPPVRICPDSDTATCTDTGWFCDSDTALNCDTAWISDTLVVREILDINNIHTVGVNDLVGGGDVDSCGRIRRLDISAFALLNLYGGRALTRLPPSIGLLTELRYLAVYNNLIDSLPASIGNCRYLSDLLVQRCGIRELPDTICSLDSLTTVYAYENGLRRLPDSLGRLRILTVLEVSGNELDSLPVSVMQCGNLSYGRFTVAHNYLCGVPGALADWLDTASYEGARGVSGNAGWMATQQNCAVLAADTMTVRDMLDSMDLDTMGVGEVAAVRAGRIARLDLGSRGLDAIPTQVYRLDSLESLILDSNAITDVPGTIDSLKVLRELSLAGNLLNPATTVTFDHLDSLRVLNLAGNRFTAAPLGLSLNDSLRELDLSANGLRALPSIDRLAALRRLRLRDNALSSLPALDSLRALEVLDAGRCSLSVINPGIGYLRELDTLDISYNLLADLPLEITWLTQPVAARVEGNHLCSLATVIEIWLDQKAGVSWPSGQSCP